jgi:hypothetical protein
VMKGTESWFCMVNEFEKLIERKWRKWSRINVFAFPYLMWFDVQAGKMDLFLFSLYKKIDVITHIFFSIGQTHHFPI